MIAMTNHLSHDTTVAELLRLKKALQFIRQVVRDYGSNTFNHLGFSHALAASKAEELRDQIEPFCPAHKAFQELVKAMHMLPTDPQSASSAERCLDEIAAYFALDTIVLIRR